MNNVSVRTQPNDQDCLRTLIGNKPIGYCNCLLRGTYFGVCVSGIVVSSSAKTAGLSTASGCGYIALGALAGASCCVTSATICNKLCINPQESTDNQMPRGGIPLAADNLHLPPKQVITQQPGELSPLPTPLVQRNTAHLSGTEFSTDNQMPRGGIPLAADNLYLLLMQLIVQQPVTSQPTPPLQRNTVHLPGTEFDPPPPYSEVVQMGDNHPPPPPYSTVIEQPATNEQDI